MIPFHFTAVLGFLLVGLYVGLRGTPTLPRIGYGDDDEASSSLLITGGRADWDVDGAYEVAVAADNAANEAAMDARNTGDANAAESEFIVESPGVNDLFDSSTVSVERNVEAAVTHDVRVVDSRLSLRTTVPEWALVVADITAEALDMICGHHPWAVLPRWNEWISDAPLWPVCLVTAPFLLAIASYCFGARPPEGARISSTRPRSNQSAVADVHSDVTVPGTGRDGAGHEDGHVQEAMTLRTIFGVSSGHRTPHLLTGNQRDGRSAPGTLTLRTVLGVSTRDNAPYLLTRNQRDGLSETGAAGYQNRPIEAAALVIQRWTRTKFRRWLLDGTARRSLERRVDERLSHGERTDQDAAGDVVLAMGIEKSDVTAGDVATPTRSVRYEGDILRRPSSATVPPSYDRANVPDEPRPEVTINRRLPLTLLRFDAPFGRQATPYQRNTRSRWPHN